MRLNPHRHLTEQVDATQQRPRDMSAKEKQTNLLSGLGNARLFYNSWITPR